jgi:hypothetical protein
VVASLLHKLKPKMITHKNMERTLISSFKYEEPILFLNKAL